MIRRFVFELHGPLCRRSLADASASRDCLSLALPTRTRAGQCRAALKQLISLDGLSMLGLCGWLHLVYGSRLNCQAMELLSPAHNFQRRYDDVLCSAVEAALSRRRHRFDSRTGRQSYQSLTKISFAEGPIIDAGAEPSFGNVCQFRR